MGEKVKLGAALLLVRLSQFMQIVGVAFSLISFRTYMGEYREILLMAQAVDKEADRAEDRERTSRVFA
jgi:hypothetical protein